MVWTVSVEVHSRTCLNNFEKGSRKKPFCEVKLKLVQWNGRSLAFVAKSLIYPFCNDAWLLCFSTNQYGLNNFCRGSPKEHLYQRILESIKQIQRRRISKFEHFASFLMPQQPKLSMEFKSFNNFERGLPKQHSSEVQWNGRSCHL